MFGGEDFEFPQQAEQWNGQDFITKIILEDKKGALFSVKPDYSGLRFAKGEITYKEYNKIQKKRGWKRSYLFIGHCRFFYVDDVHNDKVFNLKAILYLLNFIQGDIQSLGYPFSD